MTAVSLLFNLFAQLLIIAFSVTFLIKTIHQNTHIMTDLLTILGFIGFFGLMCLFLWACEKV